jgi:hypothetical protein
LSSQRTFGVVRTYGLRADQVSRATFAGRGLQKGGDYVFEVMITTTLEVPKAVLESYNKLHEIVLQLVLDDPLCQRFMMVPGVGAIVALSFEVAVDNPMRFTRSLIVSTHSGLTQRRHQSRTSIDLPATSPRWTMVGGQGLGMRIARLASMMCAIGAVAEARRYPASHVDWRL